MAGWGTTLIFLFWDCQAQWLTLEVCIVWLCLLWLEFTLLYKTHADYLKNKSCTLIRIFCSCQSRNLAQLLGYFALLNLYLLFLSLGSSFSMPTGFPELCFLRSLSSVTILQTAFLPPASSQNEYSTGLIYFFFIGSLLDFSQDMSFLMVSLETHYIFYFIENFYV